MVKVGVPARMRLGDNTKRGENFRDEKMWKALLNNKTMPTVPNSIPKSKTKKANSLMNRKLALTVVISMGFEPMTT